MSPNQPTRSTTGQLFRPQTTTYQSSPKTLQSQTLEWSSTNSWQNSPCKCLWQRLFLTLTTLFRPELCFRVKCKMGLLESFTPVTICNIHLRLDEEAGKKEERKEKGRKTFKKLRIHICTWRHAIRSEQKQEIHANHNNTLWWCWATVQIVGGKQRGIVLFVLISTCRILTGHNYMRCQRVSTSPHGMEL